MSDTQIGKLLSQLIPGELPLDVFNQVARLMVVPVIELVVEFNGKVLLKKRPSDDLYWPGQYCLPGRIISASNKSAISDQVESLYADLGFDAQGAKIAFSSAELLDTKRGTELALIYKAEITDGFDNETHIFISKEEIGGMSDIITEHREIIKNI